MRQAPTPVAVTDEHGTILFLNWGHTPFTPETVVGRMVWDFALPEDRVVVQEALASAVRTWAPVAYSCRVPAQGGVLHHYRTVIGPYRKRDGDRAAQLIQIVAEINELKDNEARLTSEIEQQQALVRLFMAHTSDIVSRIDLEGRVTYISPAVETVLGFRPAELVGRFGHEFLHPDDLEGARANAHAATFRAQRKDGRFVWFEVAKRILRDGDGKPVEMIAHLRDVTERKENEDRFHAMQSELAHVSRLSTIGELATSLAHELNQPLTAILTYAYGARNLVPRDAAKDPKAARAAEYVDEIARLADRAGQIIRRMRAFVARRERQTAREDLAAVVRSAVALTEVEARSCGVRLGAKTPAEPVAVDVDKVQIGQVLVNLVKNALDALKGSQRADRNVMIALVVDHALSVATVSVVDNGPGLGDEIRRHLFEPFRTTKAEGLGLGLPISKSIVESHGGVLVVEAGEGGGGTAARFTLPLAPSPWTDRP